MQIADGFLALCISFFRPAGRKNEIQKCIVPQGVTTMQQAFLTVDLGFGDSGKGSIVDFLTRIHAAHTVVRYNGGAQAAHRVVTDGPNPREHVFAQFGSGTLAGAATHLSRFMLLDPLAMVAEAQHLQALGVPDAFDRTTIDERALVITPLQRAANRLKELARGDGRHGSCGMGIGETMIDYLEHGQRVLFAGDLRSPDVLRTKLHFLHEINLAKIQALLPGLPDSDDAAREQSPLRDPDWPGWLVEEYIAFARYARIVPSAFLHSILRRPGAVIFEGAQGVLLDEWRGFHPYTTWSTTTFANAETLLAEAGATATRLGVIRCYMTRHGPGPFVTEDPTLELPEQHNGRNRWQGPFRVGHFDALAIRYAAEVTGGVDEVALTHQDVAARHELRLCQAYQLDGQRVERLEPGPARDLQHQEQLTRRLLRARPVYDAPGVDWQAVVEQTTGAPITLASYGPTALDKFLSQHHPARDHVTHKRGTPR